MSVSWTLRLFRDFVDLTGVLMESSGEDGGEDRGEDGSYVSWDASGGENISFTGD